MSQSTVCVSCDFDGVSPWLYLFDAWDSPTNISRGLFGVDHGAPRLLDLFDKHSIDTTWFIPGHTLESFPERCETIWSKGHDVQHHGWTHRPPSEFESKQEERMDVERGIECIESLTGRRPTGYRSPSWDFSLYTLEILQELDFEWDSSQMAADFEPYFVPTNWDASKDEPFDRGTPTDIVEIPVSWQRDDFPAFAYRSGQGFANGEAVFSAWREQFDWMHQHIENGVFVLTLHPQISGQAHRLTHLDRLLEYFTSKPGVEFRTITGYVDDQNEA